MKTNDLRENFEALANAIVIQACIDYQEQKGNSARAKMRKASIVDFFHSDLFSMITQINPDELVTRLENGDKISVNTFNV